MKALIISDIHSNIVALEAIWAREHDCDVVYCAGDLVDYGPYPREALAWVRAHVALCVRGNHDQHVAMTFHEPDLWDIPDGELQWRHHNARLLEPADAALLAGLPEAATFELDGVRYGMTHLYRDYDLILSRTAYQAFLAARFPGERIDRLILGHTHRRAVMVLGEHELWLNPGSVSYRRPDDPDQEAHYITITDGRIELKSAPYDLRTVYAEAVRHPLTEPELRVARRFFGERPAPA